MRSQSLKIRPMGEATNATNYKNIGPTEHMNHDTLRRHADQPTIHDMCIVYGKAYENNAAHRDFIHNHTHYYAGKRRRIPDEILKL